MSILPWDGNKVSKLQRTVPAHALRQPPIRVLFPAHATVRSRLDANPSASASTGFLNIVRHDGTGAIYVLPISGSIVAAYPNCTRRRRSPTA